MLDNKQKYYLNIQFNHTVYNFNDTITTSPSVFKLATS